VKRYVSIKVEKDVDGKPLTVVTVTENKVDKVDFIIFNQK